MSELGPSPTPTPPPATPPAAPAAAKPAAKPRPRRRRRRRPARRMVGLVFAGMFLLGLGGGLGSAAAAPRRARTKPAAKPAPAAVATPGETAVPVTAGKDAPAVKPGGAKEKTYDFAAMGIEGRVLAPQLLYMLGRIKVELEKGDLEKRSFIPEMVRSVDEGGL